VSLFKKGASANLIVFVRTFVLFDIVCLGCFVVRYRPRYVPPHNIIVMDSRRCRSEKAYPKVLAKWNNNTLEVLKELHVRVYQVAIYKLTHQIVFTVNLILIKQSQTNSVFTIIFRYKNKYIINFRNLSRYLHILTILLKRDNII
jgi:hypothetical protein